MMKDGLKFLVGLFIFGLLTIQAEAQIVRIEPAEATGDDEVKVIFDATQGTGGLIGASSVYMHSGIVTDAPNGTSWQFVVGNWGQNDGIGQMTPVDGEDNLWEITLSPSIRDYYGAPSGTNIFRLAMVFRNATGSVEGKGTPGAFDGGEVIANGDIYIDLVINEFITITSPTSFELFVAEGESIDINATASNTATELKIEIDTGSGFEELASNTNEASIAGTYQPLSSSALTIKVSGLINGEDVEAVSQHNVNLRGVPVVQEKPAGIREGINYHDVDPTMVTLNLLAPGKEFVYVVGDFTDWEVKDEFLMNNTPDGEEFWLEIDGLTPGEEYVFQYWVEGTIKVGDPYADKVADPWNDQFIPETVYPNLPEYTRTENGIATVLQTNQEPYVWGLGETTWERPPVEELVVYELLVRDFIGTHHYADLMDTLDYLKRLGVNAIELLPIMEFEGNESWGYNPSYFFAPDKYYGTKNELKAFIEKCHEEGFAVILDMVLNHAFGQNAMVRMYWDAQNNRPAENSPWFNPVAKHPFNVGYDFNHESPYTQAFVDSVNRYWIEEYHFDGYRYDLSKGFTQNDTGDDVGAWSAYDQSRIDLLTRMANQLWSFDNEAYVILEHFAVESEETELANRGMYLWGNMNHTYRQAAAGNNPGNFSGSRRDSHVTYMESHDEERLLWETNSFGASEGVYNIKDKKIGLNRVKMNAAFFFTVPGPKMIWMFQELGYDLAINTCPDGVTISNGCRTANKPLVWGDGSLGYYDDNERQKLFKVHGAIIHMVRDNIEVFREGNFQWVATGEAKRINITHANMDVTIVGNYATGKRSMNPNFSKSGTWYDFFTGEAIEIDNPTSQIELAPGEFHIYTDKPLPTPEPGLVDIFRPIVVTEPIRFKADDMVTIIFDAGAADPDGTDGLVGAEKVYMHAGAITSGPSDTEWNFTTGNLVDDGVGEMTKVEGENDLWSITVTPRTYFEVPEETRIYRIGMYFRDANNDNKGTDEDGSDIFVAVEPDDGLRVVRVEPEEFTDTTPIRIIFDATLASASGTAGLLGVPKVYMHSGVVTASPSGTTWTNVVGNWGQDDGVGEMAPVQGVANQWEISLTPRDYYNAPANQTIYRLAMVFRNADGTREGKGTPGDFQGGFVANNGDIFIDVKIPSTGPTTSVDTRIADQLSVYPNPTRGQLNIDLGSPLEVPGTASITDLKGRNYGTFELNSGQSEFTMNMASMPPGIFLLHLDLGSVKVVRKIVLQQ